MILEKNRIAVIKMKKRFKGIIATILILSMTATTAYAADTFAGWNSDNKRDAWDVYANTEWVRIQDDLILDGLVGSAKATVSEDVRSYEELVKEVLEENSSGFYSPDSYVEMVLGMMQILSEGKPSSEDPCCVKKWFKPDYENITAKKSIQYVVNRLFSSESAHSVHGNYANPYKCDDILGSVVQGVMFGKNYTKENEKYTLDNATTYYNTHKAEYDAQKITPDSKFADSFSNIYKTVNIGSGGTGYVDWMIKTAADNTVGYSQTTRCLNPNVDCSSFIYYGLMYGEGYNSDQLGGTWPFTTYSMGNVLSSLGFQALSRASIPMNSLQPGDILWRSNHVEVYVGNGNRVGAHSDYDGKNGDSSGTEVSVKPLTQSYYNSFSIVYRR